MELRQFYRRHRWECCRPGRDAFRAPGGSAFSSVQALSKATALVRDRCQPERDKLMSQRNSTWISECDPEGETLWKSKGKSIAQRNLIWSTFAQHLGFSLWPLSIILTTRFPHAALDYTTD